MKSAELLRNNPFIRRYFQHRFTHLLIDEFQDTDPIQAQVMMYLTAIDENETSWRKCIPAPGSLFVVGDPKQSIYRFRRADIVTYNDVKDIICSNGGKIVRLSTNFRTVGNVINWVNNVFESDDSDTEISTEPMLRFPKKDYDESPSYVALQEGRVDGNIGELSGVFRLLIPDEYSRREMAVEYEADHIARTIRNAIDTGITIPRTKKEILSGVKKQVNSDDFMIITRNRKDLSVYARELQEYGIPHKVTGGSSLNEVDELRLLYICLLTVIHPDNPVYLVAALRSELFGISDTSLYKFKKAGGRFSFYTSIPAKFSMDESQIFTDIFNRLKGYALWLSAMPPISAFEKIINDLGLMISAAIKPGGDIEAGGLAKCIEILRSVQRESWTSSQLVERIGKLVENEDKYDGISIRSEEIPAVQIMNLHKVKGLEAPVVFLANPFGESKHPADLHIDRSEDKTKGYLAVYHKISEFQSILIAHPQNWENLSEREKRFEEAENLRLRYVAATRAGSAMIITQKNKRNNTNPWKYFNDLLSADMEISNPGQQSAPKLEETLILPEEVDFAEKDIDGRYSQISSPTYKVQAAKDYALSKAKKTGDLDIPVETDHKYESENIPIPDDEHGLEWGTLIHSLLQYAMDNPDAELKNITENLLRENDLDIGLASKAITLVRSLIQSDIWQRALKSERRFTEFPFQIYSNEGDDDSKPTLIRGAIDLVFQEKDGWVIVDYKTDIINKDNLKATTNKYAPQLQLYADVWRESVKKPIKEIGIYFSYSSQYIKII